MAAIFGWLGTENEVLLQKMHSRLLHRGAEISVRSCRKATIAQATFDHSLGVGDDGACSVVLDGHIFSAPALPKTCWKESPADLILQAYSSGGLGAIGQLNGDFAFALWDWRRELLILGRDLLGAKPLFWTTLRNNCVAFSSEYKALLVLPGFDASPNIDALQQIQYSKYMPMRDRTLFSSVWSVPPGVSIAINVRGEIVGRHHAAVPPLEIQEESLEYFETLIADSFLQSVGDRLRPFRRVGVALSGGVDSIAVAFACRKHLGEIAPLHTFTAGKDADDPEVRTAALVSQRLKAEHHLVAMSPESIIEGYPHTLWFLEAPIARTETVQFYEIGRRARGLVDVIFTGAAADALYVGMPNYKLLQLYRWLPPLRYAIHEFHSLTQTGFWPRSFLGRMLTLAYFRGGLSPAPRISNSGFSPELTKLPSVTRDFISNFLHTEFQEDSAQWLPKIERTLAASGLDFASPFLDPRSIRVAFSIPERFKLHGWKEKYVLRRALRDIVDDDLTDFSKFPMQMSIDAAFVDALDVLVDEYLSHERVRARGFFDPAVIAKIKQYRRGKHCYSEGAMRAWTAVGTEIWAEQFIDRRGEPDFDILDRDLKVQSNQIDASSLPIESAPIESVVDIGAHRLKTNSSGDATGHR